MSKLISRSLASDLLSYFQEREGEVLRLARALVETESPSGDLEGSRAVVSLLEEAAHTVDVVAKVERIESVNYGEHLLIRAFADGSQPILVLGHTDTVHPRGTLRERPWRVEGDCIYGPGIFDMKANCALAVETLRALAALKVTPRFSVALLLTCDEETGSLTGRALLEDVARDSPCALVLEPPAPGGRVKTGRKGTGIFSLRVEGRAAHAGLEPEKGVSAVLELARQVERLHRLNDAARGITINVGVIQGGTRSNVVPAEATAEIDVRFSTAEDARCIEEEILHLRPFDERARLILSGGINRPPLERTEKVVSLYNLARSVADLMDYELGETQVGGASDGNFLAAKAVAVLDGLGIDGDGAHAAHEHIISTNIAHRGALIAGLIASL